MPTVERNGAVAPELIAELQERAARRLIGPATRRIARERMDRMREDFAGDTAS